MTTKQLKQLFTDLELNRSYFARKLKMAPGTFNNKLSERVNNGGTAKVKTIYAFTDSEMAIIKTELRKIANAVLIMIK